MESRTSTSRALAISEIIREVLSHIRPDAPDNRDDHYRSLLSAALCSRYFSSIALDALWRQLDSLLPLIKLLPVYLNHERVFVSHCVLSIFDSL